MSQSSAKGAAAPRHAAAELSRASGGTPDNASVSREIVKDDCRRGEIGSRVVSKFILRPLHIGNISQMRSLRRTVSNQHVPIRQLPASHAFQKIVYVFLCKRIVRPGHWNSLHDFSRLFGAQRIIFIARPVNPKSALQSRTCQSLRL